MSLPAHSSSADREAGTLRDEDRRPVSAELQFLLIAIAFVLVMLLAGVPGHENKAGDGSPALQRGWAERHAAEVAAQQPGGSTPVPDAPAPDSGR